MKHVSFENLTTFAGRMKAVYARKTEVPAKVSDLANDAGYQTEAQVSAAVAAADHLRRKIVAGKDSIDPAAKDADRCIYMVPKADSDEDDQYDEYMVLDGRVEHVGNTKVDLSGYLKASDFELVTEEEILALFADE